MKTRITELFGIKHPIMLAGMAMVSLPEMVAAVSNAGGLGTFNTAASKPDEVRDVIRYIRTLTDKPFSVNATFLLPNARENIEVALEEKVPILNYSLGKGDWLIKAAHEYGGKVISTVAVERHARRAEQDGADALVVTGYEAAAHGTYPTTMVLVPLVASQVKIPIIAAGGFCDGKGLAAALALGAEGISMGTRFLMTKDAKVHERVKEILLKSTVDDTLYSDKIDGMDGRFLKTEATIKAAAGKINLLKSISSALKVQKMMGVPMAKLFRSGLKQRSAMDLARQAVNVVGIKIAVDTGDLDSGFMPIGQVVGRINDLPTIQEVIERTIREAEEVIEATRKKIIA